MVMSTAHKIVLSKAEQFFYDHAGYSHKTDEPAWSGRTRGAILLAAAERELDSADDVYVEWEYDPEPYDGDVEWHGPVWICSIMRAGHVLPITSLSGIACEADDPYMRVIEAELAHEALGLL
jgi:hypothetical protein